MTVRSFTVADERFLEDAASKEHWNTDDTVLKLLRAYRDLRTENVNLRSAVRYCEDHHNSPDRTTDDR